MNVVLSESTQIVAARLPASESCTPGTPLTLYADATQLRLFDPETTRAIPRR